MAKPSQQQLPENPFLTYRDPKTGCWMIATSTPQNNYDLPLSLSRSTYRKITTTS